MNVFAYISEVEGQTVWAFELQVKSINGQPVNSLPDLVKAVEACKEPFLRFDLDHCHVCLSLPLHPSYVPCFGAAGLVLWLACSILHPECD